MTPTNLVGFCLSYPALIEYVTTAVRGGTFRASSNDAQKQGEPLRSKAVFEAHNVIPGRFALCAIGAKAVRVLHPKKERMGRTIDRVLRIIGEGTPISADSDANSSPSHAPSDLDSLYRPH